MKKSVTMDYWKEVREEWRSLFSQAVYSLEKELAEEKVKTARVHRYLAILENRYARIDVVNEQILELLRTVDTSEEEYTDEYESLYLFSDKLDHYRNLLRSKFGVTVSPVIISLDGMLKEWEQIVPLRESTIIKDIIVNTNYYII